MPLLLSRSDIRPLIEDLSALDDVVAAVEQSLRHSHAGHPGEAVFAGLTLTNGDELGTFYIASTGGPASLRLFPHRADGPRRNAWIGMRIDGSAGAVTALIALDDVNALRTAVPAAVGVRHLAPPGASVLAVLGSGKQARAHSRVFSRVLPSLEEIRIWSPTPEHRAVFGEEVRGLVDCEVVVADTSDLAVKDADVVTAAGKYGLGQSALETPESVRRGALVVSTTFAGLNLLGAGARLVVPTAQRPELIAAGFSSGFMRQPLPSPPFPVLELGDVLDGSMPARTADDETLVFELAGPYLWDLPIFDWVIEWALAEGRGTDFDFSDT